MTDIHICSGRFLKKEKIGQGSFGSVYRAIDTHTKKEVAIKEEEESDSNKYNLHHEYQMYRHLGKQPGFLKVIGFFKEGRKNYLVFTLVGKNLQTIRHSMGKKLDLKSTLCIARQLLQHIECLHKHDIIHRDIKPHNMAMGTNPEDIHQLYLLDLGISKRFKINNYHIPEKFTSSLRGTDLFASIHSHERLELSRRDDLESLAYVLIYLQKGSLPWQNITSHCREIRYQKILAKKLSTSIHTLCLGLEPEFKELLEYARNLIFQQKPNYAYLKEIFENLFKRKQFEDDYIYKWTLNTDHMFVKKQNEIAYKRNLEMMKQQKQLKSLKNQTKRKSNYRKDTQDLFFSPYLPIDLQRAIVIQNMRNANFPGLITPYPPLKKFKAGLAKYI